MEKIIELIDIRNKNNKRLDMMDIEYIIKELTKVFDIRRMNVINNSSKYFMEVSFRDLKIVVDYEKIKIYSQVIYANYLIMFAIFHELRHCLQVKDDGCVIGNIYQECFQYINSSSLFKNAFYSRFHDYFPVEVNANMVSLLYVLYLQKKLDDHIYYEIFKKMLIDIVDKRDDEKMQDVLISLLGDDYLMWLEGVDEYDLCINGLISDKEKQKQILKNILL